MRQTSQAERPQPYAMAARLHEEIEEIEIDGDVDAMRTNRRTQRMTSVLKKLDDRVVLVLAIDWHKTQLGIMRSKRIYSSEVGGYAQSQSKPLNSHATP